MSTTIGTIWYKTSEAPRGRWIVGKWRDEITGKPFNAASYLTIDGRWWRSIDSDDFLPTIAAMGTERPDEWRPL